jgi:serine/threonine protein phosphatase PrpC
MPRFMTAVASFHDRTEDRALVLPMGDDHIVCVADGSGGVSGATMAAELFVAGVQRAVGARDIDLGDPVAWMALLGDLDGDIARRPGAGETTGIALAVTATAVVGASVGDSRAWLFGEGATELTSEQIRKPRIGTGRSSARSFIADAKGVLVVGTDGLFDHVRIDEIGAVARKASSTNPADDLIRILRSRFRTLPDDVAVVVARLDAR